MNWLPVAARELRLLGRQRRTYRLRMLSAAVVILVSLGMLYAGFAGSLSAASAGRSLFLILASIGAVYVLLEGVIMTADCLSQEKREGTLGLLFLSGLTGPGIVLGKMVTRLAESAFCLTASLPGLAIAVFLGGVTGLDIVCVTLALLNGLFFSAAVGMLASAVCLHERRAFGLAMTGALAASVILPAVGWMLSIYRLTPAIDPTYVWLSPAGAFLDALRAPGLVAGNGFFAKSFLGTHLVAWIILLGAGWVLSWRWQKADEPKGAGTRPKPLREKSIADATRSARRQRWLEEAPLMWVGQRPSERSYGLWLLLLVLVAGWAACWLILGNQWLRVPVFAATAVLLDLCLEGLVIFQACRGPAQDRRSGVLEILLTTPVGHELYLRSRMLLLKRRCLWPVLVVLAIEFALMAAGCWDIGILNWEWLSWVAVFAIVTLQMIAELYVLSWVGLWQALKTASTARAIRTTVFYVLLLRWVLLLGLLTVLGLLTQGRVFQSAAGGAIATVLYFVALVMTLLHFGAAAFSDLQDNLRTFVISPTEERPRTWFRRKG